MLYSCAICKFNNLIRMLCNKVLHLGHVPNGSLSLPIGRSMHVSSAAARLG